MSSKAKNKATTKATTKAPTRQMWRRSVAVLVILTLFCVSVIFKLSMIQFAQADELRKRAVEQQMRDSFISPKRGTIYDINMTEISMSATVWTVIMSPNEIEDEAIRVKIADELSELLEVDRDKLYQKTLKVNSQYEIVKSKIEHPLAQMLSTWIQENKLAGVFRIIEDYKRYYPLNSLASNVLGFTGTDNNGLYGLEAYYEKTLAGKPGRIVTAKNGWGEDMPNKLKFEKTVDAQDGNSLVLTIDSVVQYYAEKHLEIAVKENLCANRGSAIVMEVDTGAIVAMATKGDFDPNSPMTVTNPDTLTKIALLSGDERAAAVKSALEKQWVNKPISDYYEPGSVFKAFTAAMALEEGRITDNWSYYCKGSMVVVPGTKPVSCHRKTGHGSQSFAQALSNSCNPAFMTIGLDVGRKLFFKYFSGFGFTDRTGIDMLSESKVTDLLFHDESELNIMQLAVSSFGQTFKVTPIQMITAMSAIANGGRLMQPYVVRQILNSKGNIISNTQPIVKRQVISESTTEQLNKILADSVNGGGAKNAYIAGYRIAGKTGTSDKTDQNNAQGTNNVVASFAGFAPADNPKYAILVMLDEPQCDIRFGGTLAAPLAQKIFSEALPYLGIEPKYTEEEIAAMDRTTPGVNEKKVSVAQTMLKNLGLKYHVVGSGDTVIKQIPDKGESIPKNGTVVLYTDENELSKTTVVPDFRGKTMSQANMAAVNANPNIEISGLGLDSGEAKAGKQSIEAGKRVLLGTVVKVDFVYNDEIR